MKQIDDASKALKDWGSEAKERVEDISGRVEDKAKIIHSKGKLYVTQNPEKSMLMAAGVGVAVGALIALIFTGRNRD